MTNEALGSAAVLGLSMIENAGGVPYLLRLQTRTTLPKVRKRITTRLEEAAKRGGLTRVDLEELSAPDHGLAKGERRLQVGSGAALMTVEAGNLRISWEDADKKVRKSLPKALKEEDPDGAKSARAIAKEIQADLTTQKRRLDALYLQPHSWSYEIWRERYADHGTLAPLSRTLLWSAEKAGATHIILPTRDGSIDADGNHVDCREATMRLWHPLDSNPETVRTWRQVLMDREIVQPLRQVWRETYELTNAERDTSTYSNRFAGHIVRQHQMMALAHQNGWQCTHKVGFDVPNEDPSHIRLPAFGLQAEYWTETVTRGAPTNNSGAYLYLATDRLKFHSLDEKAQYGQGEEVPLEQIPALVFSEIMRHCDLFASVASIGLDPEWMDGGRDAEHPNDWRRTADSYWENSQNAALNMSASVRREMLATLLDRMKKTDVFQLQERHLRIVGKLNTYLIHLGSGGVQIEPTRRHICIVKLSSSRDVLPFDGDDVLSLILSKALLLERDDKIKDPVIVTQIK